MRESPRKETERHETELGFEQLSQFDRADQICDLFEREWLEGRRPRLEDYLAHAPAAECDNLRRELEAIQGDYEQRRHAAKVTSGVQETLVLDHPSETRERQDHPSQIDRYLIKRLLGEGGFGRVYLAHDEQLRRLVAVKVPHVRLLARPTSAESYLAEARIVANLDHPHIVPVYDVGSTSDFPCYVVSKYVEGCDLASLMKEVRRGYCEVAELVATVGEALHFAHTQGVVHRDVKPGNILLGSNGTPYVVDFGLALQEVHLGEGPQYLGTPAYMSPEQARGEGHRVDGRSDVFSLGVVFYELLVGRRPFRGDTQAKLLEQVTSYEPRPLRQYDDQIPKELERICHKAMAKRVSERYSTAKDLADDLRHFLAEQSRIQSAATDSGMGSGAAETQGSASSATSTGSSAASSASRDPGTFSDSQNVNIVPKGLHAFDAHDADFFPELLPGPRDREGLPDSLRFWKNRIEEPDPDNTFTVGLIYGPSGCGKSSLVKAGLLPRLSEEVISVYVEATPHDTETRLLHGLQKKCPALEHNLSLQKTTATLRRGQGVAIGKKVLIILDQFEQWLHAGKEQENSQLVQALRQCDGGRVQCIVMVRDDFWMAATRFMRDLEVRLVEAQNSAAVDLFPVRHAEKVLAALGRAFGTLPASFSDMNKEQKDFLKQSVAGLAEEGKVICVRLALFAEMMKHRPWTPTTLKEVGGTTGLGLTFLEETFSGSTASPAHRYHQKPARAVLKALLPESGTNIKGQMKSYDELLEASGRPDDFDELIRTLDSGTRLITPTDPEGVDTEDESVSQAEAGQKYYQLTHDYLVPSLREWLTKKQKETRRGRAQLLLTELATEWRLKGERRKLPSWREWLRIRLFSARQDWSVTERELLRHAGRHYLVRGAILTLACCLIGFAGIEAYARFWTQAALQRVLDADIRQLPDILLEMQPYRRRMKPLLQAAYDQEHASSPSNSDEKKLLNLSIALQPDDPRCVSYLKIRLLDASPIEFHVIRETLLNHQVELRAELWHVLRDPASKRRHLQAASALALYSPEDQEWTRSGDIVLDALTDTGAISRGQWLEYLRPVRKHLIPALGTAFRDSDPSRAMRSSLATSVLADFAADQPQLLIDLILDADPNQFPVLFPKLQPFGDRAIAQLVSELQPNSDEARPGLAEPQPNLGVYSAGNIAFEAREKRRAAAALCLVRLGAPQQAWKLLQQGRDTTARSHFVHRFRTFGGEPETLLQRLNTERDVSTRRALIIALGEFALTQLPPEQRVAAVDKLCALYRTDDDPGVHGAAEWLLRHWEMASRLQEEQIAFSGDLTASPRPPQRRWYFDKQGHTMVLLEAGNFYMGDPNMGQHQKRIGRTIAISSKEVTRAQFRRFEAATTARRVIGTDIYGPTDDSPAIQVTWFDAAAYCDWMSAEEGIEKSQRCYVPNADGDFAEGMTVAPDFLERTGYRLPTEAEWEFASRSGTTAPWPLGACSDYLPRYAWYQENAGNRARPVGSLRPNDNGLFDMLGNVYEWCHDAQYLYPGDTGAAQEEQFEDRPVGDDRNRTLRGGGYLNPLTEVHPSNRYDLPPSDRHYFVGFRIARTIRSND